MRALSPALCALRRRTRLTHARTPAVAFRKPFTPPTSKQVIQVRHQHYQGEDHPAARKVVLTVPVASLPLKNAAAVHKLQLLAGARWEPPLPEALRAKSFKGKERSLQPEGQEDRGTLKIACELFPASRMNEKWCSDTLDKLLSEANVHSLHGPPFSASLFPVPSRG